MTPLLRALSLILVPNWIDSKQVKLAARGENTITLATSTGPFSSRQAIAAFV